MNTKEVKNVNCPHCSADIPDMSNFCVQCGRSIEPSEGSIESVTSFQGKPDINGAQPAGVLSAQAEPDPPPVPFVPSNFTVPPSLSEPIVFTEDDLYKEFGELISHKGRPPVGMGYATALFSLAAFVLLFIPMFDTQTLFGISTNGSLFSVLTILLRPDIHAVAAGALTQTGFELVSGLSLGNILTLMSIGFILIFALPVINFILSFVAWGNTRFYLLLVTSLAGGGIFFVLRAVTDNLSVQLGSTAGALIPSFIPSILFSIAAYFLTLLFAFFGCKRKPKPDAGGSLPAGTLDCPKIL